ncbi:MAG: hypothetical protein Q8O76_12915, partial [Chloroflexota bacterium]|nr:hypothetical protein [Chloroflexota bacterium]
DATQRDLIIYWGIKGFSIRVQTPQGNVVTLLYGFPPGASGREEACIQAYTRDLGEPEYQQAIQRRYAEIDGTVRRGSYTVDLPLVNNAHNRAIQLVERVFEVAAELKSRTAP